MLIFTRKQGETVEEAAHIVWKGRFAFVKIYKCIFSFAKAPSNWNTETKGTSSCILAFFCAAEICSRPDTFLPLRVKMLACTSLEQKWITKSLHSFCQIRRTTFTHFHWKLQFLTCPIAPLKLIVLPPSDTSRFQRRTKLFCLGVRKQTNHDCVCFSFWQTRSQNREWCEVQSIAFALLSWNNCGWWIVVTTFSHSSLSNKSFPQWTKKTVESWVHVELS